MLYKTELHCHTAEASQCAGENADDTVKKYVDAGYTTVVLTNHIDGLNKFFSSDENEKGIEFFLEGYRKFEECAKGKLNVLLGAEVTFKNSIHNHYLVYGITEEFLRENPNLRDMNAKALHNLCVENGFLLVQAHPFRHNTTLTRPEHLDGIEVFNGHIKHKTQNDMSDIWANYYGLIKTSGSDHHNSDHPADCGILTDEPITSNEQLISVLKSGDYRIMRYYQ